MGFLYAAFGAVFLTTLVTLGEFVAPIERFSLKSRIPGLLFTTIAAAGSVMFLSALISLWREVGVGPILTLPIRGWTGDLIAVALAILFTDFISYWNHRFQHRFLWPIHAVHHSQTELHAANGYAHFSERGLRFLFLGIPLSLIHFDFGAVPYVATVVGGVLERYVHSPTSVHFGPVRALLVDNRFHRIHHSMEPKHFDKNFGILFSFWDRLFGTVWEPREGEWPGTGVPDVPPPRTITDYLLFPLRFAPQGRKLAVVQRTWITPTPSE